RLLARPRLERGIGQGERIRPAAHDLEELARALPGCAQGIGQIVGVSAQELGVVLAHAAPEARVQIDERELAEPSDEQLVVLAHGFLCAFSGSCGAAILAVSAASGSAAAGSAPAPAPPAEAAPRSFWSSSAADGARPSPASSSPCMAAFTSASIASSS